MSNTKKNKDYEERKLIKEIQEHHDQEALETILSRYQEFVYSYINHHVDKKALTYIQADDLVQEGMLGLQNAILQFDLTKNSKFCTIARKYIKAQITQLIQQNELTIQPSMIDEKDVLTQASEENISKTVQQTFDFQLIQLALKRILTAREYYILYHRYYAPVTKTPKELSQILDTSQQNIASIQKNGLNKIRQLWPNSELEITELLASAGITQYEIEHLDQLRLVPLEPETIYEFTKLKGFLTREEYDAFYLANIYEFYLSHLEIAELLGLSLGELEEIYQTIDEQVTKTDDSDDVIITFNGRISSVEIKPENMDSAWRWLQRNTMQSVNDIQKTK